MVSLCCVPVHFALLDHFVSLNRFCSSVICCRYIFNMIRLKIIVLGGSGVMKIVTKRSIIESSFGNNKLDTNIAFNTHKKSCVWALQIHEKLSLKVEVY